MRKRHASQYANFGSLLFIPSSCYFKSVCMTPHLPKELNLFIMDVILNFNFFVL